MDEEYIYQMVCGVMIIAVIIVTICYVVFE